MSDSILDRVLSRREDQEKEAFDAVDCVAQVLKLVSTKEADILRRRYGLREEGAETLEKIGLAYEVTRERIRQIEHQALDQLRSSVHANDFLAGVERLVVSLLNTHGGILAEEYMYELLLGMSKDVPLYRRCLTFLLNQVCTDAIEEVQASQNFKAGWKLHTTSLAYIENAIQELSNLCEHSGIPLTLAALIEAFQQTTLYAQHPAVFTEHAVTSIIGISKHIGKNPFDEYGLITWGLISPKRMNDRVYMVLKKEGKPMHFEEIAERISKIFKKRAYPPTVHNELILNDQYVLVGRGLYALKEWGYSEGVVSEVLRDILRQAHKPMSKVDLVNAVLSQRMVKKNTILLALSDKTLFHKTREGLYTIAASEQPINAHTS
ncbi:MAG: hypothetical protein KIH62_004400 [Candidatus Kerfeldbacteria bacterium]|nr:hypothetical protein [Candidatus Kerfeldbacteria bacterium]